MNKKNIIKNTLDSIIDSGADKAVVKLEDIEKQELNVDAGEISLFRTTFDVSLTLIAIVNNKKGQCTINKLDNDSIDSAVKQVIDFANSSEADEANEISEYQEAGEFKNGLDSPDKDKMFEMMDEFLKTANKRYPKVIIEQGILDFIKQKKYFQNSNGVDYVSESGYYYFMTMFVSKDGEKSSSFNYTQFGFDELDKELIERSYLDSLLKQSEEMLGAVSIGDKFVGDIIITPDAFDYFSNFIVSNISDYEMIKGTSIYQDKINEKIASEKLTIHSKPLSRDFVAGYPFTRDGYLSGNCAIIEKGVLKSYLLGQYGSLKTGKERSLTNGGCWDIEPGDTGFEDMIKSVKRGVLLCRFSGGMPNIKGDFSGVAKNSFYIEDGKIKHALSETMVSGNVPELMNNIKAVSKERISSGDAIVPWIHIGGATISGKS